LLHNVTKHEMLLKLGFELKTIASNAGSKPQNCPWVVVAFVGEVRLRV
jgi:hypothetical protein